MGEAGSGTFTVKLATQPSGQHLHREVATQPKVNVTVSSDDTGAATVSPASLTFTTTNWNSTQTVTVSGVNDSDTDNESLTVTASASGGGYGSKTASVSVSVTDDDTALTVPGAPRNLRATADGQTQINLSWNAPTDDGGASITGYRIEVSDDSGSNWSDLDSDTGSSIRTYSHTGLSAGTTPHYRVSAINAVGTGGPSNVATTTSLQIYIYFTEKYGENKPLDGDAQNTIEADCRVEKYFRAFWTDPNDPPADEWKESHRTFRIGDDQTSSTESTAEIAVQTEFRYTGGNKRHPELIGKVTIYSKGNRYVSFSFQVSGRYGDDWSDYSWPSLLSCSQVDDTNQ